MPTRPKPSAKNAQGNVEYERFTNLVDQVLSVPHSVIKERIEEHRRAVARNPHRPGPKRLAHAASVDRQMEHLLCTLERQRK